jgi:hypothetical protein
MWGKLYGLAKRAKGKPLGVIAFRLRQAITLVWLSRSGAWWRISQRALHSADLASQHINGLVLFAEKTSPLSDNQSTLLAEAASAIQLSSFRIFGQQVPDLNTCDFSVDWRFNHRWRPQYFKKYGFYESRQIPYDVKFPWELSRLHYLVPVMTSQLCGNVNEASLSWVCELLLRWRQENPLAHSVNWYPMEASMRVVSLTMLLDCVTLLRRREHSDSISETLQSCAAHLLTTIREHADFIWYNREYSDVRGNHFTANLVALSLAHQALDANGMADPRWQKYADFWIEKEIIHQFCADGVNFEKSCGYHKLVLELFLLAAIVAERRGAPLSETVRKRLAKAAEFSDSISRPDGIAANFGDSDDAFGLPFLVDRPRNHGPVVALARAFFAAPIGNKLFGDEDDLAALFLVGNSGPLPQQGLGVEVSHFSDGGYVIVRNQANDFFFMADVGEVGMSGRGGHGHNDLLSFELFFDGLPVVVDPGCPVYTGDLEKKAWFKGTAAHATVQLYDVEMARFTGPWTICDDAHPVDVSLTASPHGATLCAGHTGFERLDYHGQVRRQFDIDAHSQRLEIRDEITISGEPTLASWQFPLGCQQVQMHNDLALNFNNSKFSFTTNEEQGFQLEDASFSTGYGIEESGKVASLSKLLSAGRHESRFQISRRDKEAN